MRVVTPEDFVIQKLRKLKSDRRRVLQDAADLRALMERRPDLDWPYVRDRIDAEDLALLDAFRGLSDEAILDRLTR